MSIARANVEVILVKRAGKLMTAADLDGVTINGTNADLNDPIGVAIRKLDGVVTDPTAVADADLAGVSTDDYDQLFDIAEARLLENVSGNLDDVDITVGPRSEKLSQLKDQVDAKLKRLYERMEKEYGIGLMALEAGVIEMGFATEGDDTEY